MIGAALLVLASASDAVPMQGGISEDPFAVMRMVVAPALACERRFDPERRKLTDEMRQIDAMPTYSVAERQQWQAAWDAHLAKDRDYKVRRGTECKTEVAFDRLKVHLAKLRPDLSPGDVHLFALGFFHDLRRTAEYAADFADGYDARQYSPPSPPPAPKAKTGS